jgi:hypothetical protein
MIVKEINIRFGLDSAGLCQLLMVTCCELRDEPPVFTNKLEFYMQVVGHYQFQMKRLPLRSLFNRLLTGHLSGHRRVCSMVPWGATIIVNR